MVQVLPLEVTNTKLTCIYAKSMQHFFCYISIDCVLRLLKADHSICEGENNGKDGWSRRHLGE